MKKSLLLIAFLCLYLSVIAQLFTGSEAEKYIAGAQKVWLNGTTLAPSYIELSADNAFDIKYLDQWLVNNLGNSDMISNYQYSVVKDSKTVTHYRYQQFFEGIPVFDAHYVIHEIKGRIRSLNGNFINNIQIVNNLIYSGEDARCAALNYINADMYKWQISGEEELLKEITKNPDASFYPKAELILFPSSGFGKSEHKYAYKFDIYADKPLRRTEVFVDAENGEILFTNDILQVIDSQGTAVTAYSGTQDITTDSINEGYRLRETGRGNGIETYDMNQGTTYSAAVDFTDSDNFWDNPNSEFDQYATDAHWGAEMTYDYYYVNFNRNSIDDLGFQLRSYIHYDQAYANAFWDGLRMTYGDGDGVWSPLTALDICGHEITHGLTSFTSNLNYSYESGAMNEGYSDIFGTAIEFYAKPNLANWLMGENIGSAIRSLSDPGFSDQPDTYLGTNWYVGSGDNGGVHTNSGVMNFWFYLLSEGGTGTNDNGDVYNVNGIGIEDAAKIAYRTLTVYLVPTSEYADASFYSILSAIDLFGGCSPEVESTTNALYAVGLSSPYTSEVVADFTPSATSFCTVPAQIHFTNNSVNAVTFSWDFGDGTVSTLINPDHSYFTNGTYTVSLKVDGGACGADSVVYPNLITINTPVAPQVTSASNCGGAASLTLTAIAPDSVRWYTSQTGGNYFYTGTSYTTPVLSQSTHYFVENQVANAAIYGGKTDNTGGGSYSTSNSSRALIFTTFVPVTIKSVKVYANDSGIRNIELRDASGTTLQNANIDIPSGESRITLNFNVPAGIDYELAGPANPKLYRNNNGCSYPYAIGGLATITKSSLAFNPTGSYYYFYDWEVSEQACASERIKVDAWINFSNPVSSFTVNTYGLFCNFTNTSVDGNEYLWDFGDGNTSVDINPGHIYAAPGLYDVTLTVTNSCGTDVTIQSINVIAGSLEEDISSQFVDIHPNPAHDRIFLNYMDNSAEGIVVTITNITGQEVAKYGLSGNSGVQNTGLDMSKLPRGTYIISVYSDQNSFHKRIILQ